MLLKLNSVQAGDTVGRKTVVLVTYGSVVLYCEDCHNVVREIKSAVHVRCKFCNERRLSTGKVWTTYKNMIKRTSYIKDKTAHRYVGRGITVCELWKNDYWYFYEWAMKNGFKDGLQLDRKNNDGNYDPNNCRFVSPTENARNTSRNRMLLAFGEVKCVSEWAQDKRCLVGISTLFSRIDQLGWDAEDAIVIEKGGKRV